jgi:hypothetical protein
MRTLGAAPAAIPIRKMTIGIARPFCRRLDGESAMPKRMTDRPELKLVNVHAATQLPATSDQNAHGSSRRPGLTPLCPGLAQSRRTCTIWRTGSKRVRDQWPAGHGIRVKPHSHIKHEAIPGYGSFEVWFPDGRKKPVFLLERHPGPPT